jgi:hypothetical protein
MMMMMMALLLGGASASSGRSETLAVTCSFATGCTIRVDGAQWSAGKTTKTRANGQWCSSADGTLEPKTSHAIAGSDAMGEYSGTALLWNCRGVPYETAVRVYNTPEGDAAVFSQRWPEGAADTALGVPKVPAVRPGVQEEVASVFPSISPTGEPGQKYMVVYNQVSRSSHSLLTLVFSSATRGSLHCCTRVSVCRWWVGWQTAPSMVPGAPLQPRVAASNLAQWRVPWFSSRRAGKHPLDSY